MSPILERMTTPAGLALAILAAAAATLGGAHALEAFAGLKPCPLCLGQRVPYWWSLGAAGLTVAAVWPGLRLPRHAGTLGFAALAVMFAVSAGLAVQHIGVEEKWWTAGCVGDGGQSVDDLLAGIAGQALVRCDEKTPFLFGLTLAAYNLMVSLGLFGLAVLGGAKTLGWRATASTGANGHGSFPQRPAPAAEGPAPGRPDGLEAPGRDPAG